MKTNYNLGDKVTIKLWLLDRNFNEYSKEEVVEIISYTVNIKDKTQKKYYKLSNNWLLGDIKNAEEHNIRTSKMIDINTLQNAKFYN